MYVAAKNKHQHYTFSAGFNDTRLDALADVLLFFYFCGLISVACTTLNKLFAFLLPIYNSCMNNPYTRYKNSGMYYFDGILFCTYLM